MNKIKEQIGFIIAFVGICIASFFVLFRVAHPTYDVSRVESINEINLLRVEIVKLDSIRKSEQRIQVDSMMQEIKVTQYKAERINSINQKLRQQNEKLDRIYNSIHDDMPDF